MSDLLLRHAGWELALRPALGGAITALRLDGAEVLRSAPAEATHPLDASCFPLVPYANRIADGRFTLDGESYELPRNAAGQDHPLHGVGWLREWSVEAADERSATLTHSHDGDQHWPWAYAAKQRFELSDDGLRVTLSVTNRDARALPISLGLHPYFAKAGVTRLRFAAASVWLADAGFLPTDLAPVDTLGDWLVGETVDRPALIDNCYTGWSGEAIIAREAGDLRLSGENTPFLHLFTPPGQAFFCAEPVTAMPDALNRATPVMLKPGEDHAIAMTIARA